jgi:hypothetical protein
LPLQPANSFAWLLHCENYGTPECLIAPPTIAEFLGNIPRYSHAFTPDDVRQIVDHIERGFAGRTND